MTQTLFTRTKDLEGINTYTFVDDPRFSVVAETRITLLGVGPIVFGNYTYGDGHLEVTSWYVAVEGTTKRFAPGKCAQCKAKIQDPVFRAWAIERAGI